jgi:uncharacterized membrane protein
MKKIFVFLAIAYALTTGMVVATLVAHMRVDEL